MRQRGQGCLLRAGRLFTLSRPQPQHQKKQEEAGMMGGEVKSLCYLFEGRPYRGLQSLGE